MLLAATALFVVGVTVERIQEPAGRSHSETSSESSGGSSGETSGESTEGEHANEPGGEETGHAETGNGETVLGVDVESTPFVLLAVLSALAVAAAAWVRPLPWVLLVGAAYALVAAVLDVREVVHQLDEDRAGIATLAVGVAVLHLLAAGAAGLGVIAPVESAAVDA